VVNGAIAAEVKKKKSGLKGNGKKECKESQSPPRGELEDLSFEVV